jgi:hypothetical protein
MVALLLLAWALYLAPALENPLHADEALYGYWGLLIGRGRDPWLATVPVYKPPLLPYLVSGPQALLGNSAFALRLPGLASGLLSIPLVASLAWGLYRDRWVALGAAIALALSPFAIQFSATAFMDPVMVALGLGACVAAVRGRPGWAGLLAGLSFATKQTGLIWFPLALGLGLIQTPAPTCPCRSEPTHRPSFPVGHWSLVIAHLPYLLFFSLIAASTFLWDSVRVARGAQSYWHLGVTGYGGLRLIWPGDLWTRLWRWLDLACYFFVSPVINVVLLGGLPVLVWWAMARRRYFRTSLVDLILITFTLTYALLHWLWAFPIWDRYLLPLVPILALLLSRILSLLASWIGRWRPAMGHWSLLIAHFLLFLLLLSPATRAARSLYPVGSDHRVYEGVDEVAQFLRGVPEGSVVYHHWLGWHYRDLLFDAQVYLAYWPTPAWLAQDVQVFGAKEPRYIAFPSWESSARVERALEGVGYALDPALTTFRRDGTRSFTVYQIQPVTDP